MLGTFRDHGAFKQSGPACKQALPSFNPYESSA